jgi:anti-anti-sigma factor
MSAQSRLLIAVEDDDWIAVKFTKTLSLRGNNIPRIAIELFRMASRLGRRTLSVDLGKVDFLTGMALGQLIRLHKKVLVEGGRLMLCNLSPPVYEVFEIARLHEVMDITLAVQPA